jgi:flagellar L-ring protein precursor FlgH
MLFAALIFSGVASAASLWQANTAQSMMYSDPRAHAVGDIITILINESSSAIRTGNASNTKTTSTSMTGGVGIFHGIANASTGNADSFAAKGSLSNTNVLTGRMTAQITKVDPNGNFEISGTQTIVQNGETQTITVSGTVRSVDVATDNTVLSSDISNEQIRINGKGPIAGKQREGILTQLFNFLF